MFEPREIDRYRGFIQAMVRKAGQDDPESFALAVQLLDEGRAALVDAAEALRTQDGVAGGYSWDDIARALGVTRQSAWERFRRRVAAA